MEIRARRLKKVSWRSDMFNYYADAEVGLVVVKAFFNLLCGDVVAISRCSLCNKQYWCFNKCSRLRLISFSDVHVKEIRTE